MINNLFRKAKNNEMINTSFYTGIGTAIGFISSFVVYKIIAVVIGPSGVAMVSQFQNFIGVSTSVATGGVQQGVIKYIAEVRENEEAKSKILSTSLKITLIFTFLVGIITSFLSSFISIRLFGSTEYRFVILLFGATVVLFGLNKLLMSILNGTGEIKKLVAVKISSNLFGLFITATASYLFGLKGALIALAISQSVIFFISLLFVIKSDWFKVRLFNKAIDKEYMIKLFKYSLMALSSMVLPPLVQIGIRNHIIEVLTIDQAGYWDGLWKISNAYLGIITMTLSIYYLPKLSYLKERLEIRKEILNGYKIIVPVSILSTSTVYLLKDFIIVILYSNEFIEMSELFIPQLIGDFFKIMAWLIGYIMLAKAKTKLFIFIQVYASIVTYFLSIYLINLWGIEGVVWAHAFKFIFHFFFLLTILRKYVFR